VSCRAGLNGGGTIKKPDSSSLSGGPVDGEEKISAGDAPRPLPPNFRGGPRESGRAPLPVWKGTTSTPVKISQQSMRRKQITGRWYQTMGANTAVKIGQEGRKGEGPANGGREQGGLSVRDSNLQEWNLGANPKTKSVRAYL